MSSGAHTIPLPLASQTTSPAVYCSRNPRLSPLFRLVEDYAEEYERGYEERFAHEFGPWRPHVGDVLALPITHKVGLNKVRHSCYTGGSDWSESDSATAIETPERGAGASTSRRESQHPPHGTGRPSL